jgi:serine/threonine protein kinase
MIPVVADFGLAFYSLDNDDCLISDNPEDYLWQSHETRYAPVCRLMMLRSQVCELTRIQEHQWQFGPPWAPLGEKTDVWGIGSILWHLLTHRTLDEGPVREDRHDQKAYIPISSHKYPENKEPLNDYTTLSGRLFPESSGYSAKLKDLVRACLNWSQEDRPTLQHILDEANHHLHERGTKKTLKEWGDFELALPMKFDGYQIGVRYSSTPDTTSSIV